MKTTRCTFVPRQTETRERTSWLRGVTHTDRDMEQSERRDREREPGYADTGNACFFDAAAAVLLLRHTVTTAPASALLRPPSPTYPPPVLLCMLSPLVSCSISRSVCLYMYVTLAQEARPPSIHPPCLSPHTSGRSPSYSLIRQHMLLPSEGKELREQEEKDLRKEMFRFHRNRR